MVAGACRQTGQTTSSSMLMNVLTICMVAFMQTGSTTLVPAFTSPLMNSSSIPSSPTSSALPCSCVVLGGTLESYWEGLDSGEPGIVATVYETVVVRGNVTLTTATTSYSIASSLLDQGYDYLNGTLTYFSEGYAYVYPTDYYQIDDFSYDLCISENDTDFNPQSLPTIDFPYKGITNSPYITPAPTDSTSGFASFFELIGFPTTCTFVPTGAPFYLASQSAITVTSTVSVTEEAKPLSTVARATPLTVSSMTSPGSYHLESATAMTTGPVVAPTFATSSNLVSATAMTTGSVVAPTIATSSNNGIELSTSENLSASSTTPTSNGLDAPTVIIISLTDATLTTRAPVFTIANSIITANSISQYQYNTQVLTPGGQITVSGTTISLAPFGTALVVAGVTGSVNPVAKPLPPDITIGGTVVKPNSAGDYTFATQILSPGGQITVSGTPISLVPSGTAIVVAGSTRAIVSAVQPPPVTFDGIIITPNSASDYIIASQTLAPGGSAITISGTPYSLASVAPYTTLADTAYKISSTDIVIFPTLTIDGSAITFNAASEYIIETQTIVPGGPAVTISGTPYSLAPSASFLVEGATTESLAVQTSVIGIGGYIISGLGGLPTETGGGTNITLYTGGTGLSSKPYGTMTEWIFILGVSLLIMVW